MYLSCFQVLFFVFKLSLFVCLFKCVFQLADAFDHAFTLCFVVARINKNDLRNVLFPDHLYIIGNMFYHMPPYSFLLPLLLCVFLFLFSFFLQFQNHLTVIIQMHDHGIPGTDAVSIENGICNCTMCGNSLIF